MKSTLDDIKHHLQPELKTFRQNIKEALNSDIYLIKTISKYILYKNKRKEIRPILVILASKLFGQANEITYKAASMIELIHCSSIIHDDIIDNSNIRRNKFTINALWKNKISVLIGDFFLSKALLIGTKCPDILNIISQTVKEISEGEIMQLKKMRTISINEDDYFEIIKKKTASLIECCCACGAISNGADEKQLIDIRKFGQYIGISFQIKDDIFDYHSSRKNILIGKPTQNDIKQKKVTLPLIYTLKKSSPKEKRFIHNFLKDKKNKNLSKLIDIVKEKNGIELAKKKMEEYKSLAMDYLNKFKESENKQNLKNLMEFICNRNY